MVLLVLMTTMINVDMISYPSLDVTCCFQLAQQLVVFCRHLREKIHQIFFLLREQKIKMSPECEFKSCRKGLLCVLKMLSAG